MTDDGIQFREGLRVRFPTQSNDFRKGAELGMLLTLMAIGHDRIQRLVHRRVVGYAFEMAETMGYDASATQETDGIRLVLTKKINRRETLQDRMNRAGLKLI